MNSSSFAIGVDFGGTSVKLARVDASGRISARDSFPTPPGVPAWLDALAPRVAALVASAPDPSACAGVGVGVPGFVDFSRGFVFDLANVPGWKEVPLADLISKRLSMPARIENDVNAMAAGECAFGAGRGLSTAIFVTLGTGVGGGLLVDGKLFRGAHSMAGEIGHMSIELHGVRSPMGIGGVEQYVGNRRIVEYALSILPSDPSSALASIPPAELSPKSIAEAAAASDPLALRVFDHVAECLASMLASAAYLLQPQAFIIGGGVANAGPVLFSPLRAHLAERLNPVFFSRLDILPAALGSDAGAIGCASLLLRP